MIIPPANNKKKDMTMNRKESSSVNPVKHACATFCKALPRVGIGIVPTVAIATCALTAKIVG